MDEVARRLPPRDGQPQSLPRSTASDILSGKRMPSRDNLGTLLTACGLTDAEQEPWTVAWQRLASPSAPAPVCRHTRSRLLAWAAAVAAFSVMTTLVALFAVGRAPERTRTLGSQKLMVVSRSWTHITPDAKDVTHVGEVGSGPRWFSCWTRGEWLDDRGHFSSVRVRTANDDGRKDLFISLDFPCRRQVGPRCGISATLIAYTTPAGNGAAGFDVDQYGSTDVALAEGEVVHTEDLGARPRLRSGGARISLSRVFGACPGTRAASPNGPRRGWPASRRRPAGARWKQAARAVAKRQPLDLFGQGTSCAVPATAAEPADRRQDLHRPTPPAARSAIRRDHGSPTRGFSLPTQHSSSSSLSPKNRARRVMPPAVLPYHAGRPRW